MEENHIDIFKTSDGFVTNSIERIDLINGSESIEDIKFTIKEHPCQNYVTKIAQRRLRVLARREEVQANIEAAKLHRRNRIHG